MQGVRQLPRFGKALPEGSASLYDARCFFVPAFCAEYCLRFAYVFDGQFKRGSLLGGPGSLDAQQPFSQAPVFKCAGREAAPLRYVAANSFTFVMLVKFVDWAGS